MHQVYIALGSNLNSPMAQVRQACEELANLQQSELLNISPLYASKPLGPQDQPDFINGVVHIQTSLNPVELLAQLQKIEAMHQRVKTRHWGERTLDLDILLFDDLVINTPSLVIPHYDMQNRAFVIYPLMDIAPNLVLPNGVTIQDLSAQIPATGLTKIAS